MDAVLEDATIHQRRQTLHKMTKGLGLDDAYSTTLSRIREQKGNKAKMGMEALMWISRCERLLKAQELCHALAVEVGTTDLNFHNIPSIRTLLSCTLGLVTIDEQKSTVRLVHFTLQEYFAAHPNLFITAHSMMAEICLTYLHFQSICELPTALRAIPPVAPFLHYASCYWGFHARKEMTEAVKRLAIRHLERDANHISADILLREKTVDFSSWVLSHNGKHPNLRGFTGLHCISYMGVAEIAIDMVKMRKWDLNGRDSIGGTPLIWAAKHGNLALVKLLLQQAAVDPTLSNRWDQTPLIHATKAGHEDVVKILLGRGDVNPHSSDEAGRTPLSYAAESGLGGVVRVLLEREDVGPDSSDKAGRTPLLYAASSGNEGVVKILLERGGVNPDSSDKDGRTPLSYAATAYENNEGMVKILLERGDVNPDSSDKAGRTPLSYAAESGLGGVVRVLLEREDVNPNSWSKAGRTPLSYAAESGHGGVVKMLLERGDVNPDSSDEDGRTPLSWAAGPRTCWEMTKYEGVVKILLERQDVNPNSWSKAGRTPLSYAAAYGNTGVVKKLLERWDINPDSSDEAGRTALSYAAKSGHGGVVRVLLERGDVNPNSLDMAGCTPLSYAAGSGHAGVVKMLFERGDVNPDSSHRHGPTVPTLPLLASLAGHNDSMSPSLEPRPFTHEISPNVDQTQQISVPATSASERVQFGPLSQMRGIISHPRHDVTEVISFPHFEKPPPNQLVAPPSASAPAPTLTSDTTPDPTISQPSRPLKRRRETPPLLCPSKRQHFPL